MVASAATGQKAQGGQRDGALCRMVVVAALNIDSLKAAERNREGTACCELSHAQGPDAAEQLVATFTNDHLAVATNGEVYRCVARFGKRTGRLEGGAACADLGATFCVVALMRGGVGVVCLQW